MRIFQEVTIKLEKKITTDVVLARIKKIINNPEKVLFAFDQYIKYTKNPRTNYIGKAIKNQPELERFQYYSFEARHHKDSKEEIQLMQSEIGEDKDIFNHVIPVKENIKLRKFNDYDKVIISNMGGFWYKNNLEQKIEYIDFQIIDKIIEEMSRKYPFHEANIIFEDIDWFENGEQQKEHILKRSSLKSIRCLGSNIFFTSLGHWSGKRMLFLDAYIELPIPDEKAKKLPKLPEKVIEKLSYLGKPNLGKYFVELDLQSQKELEEKKEKLTSLKYENLHNQIPFVYDKLQWGEMHDTVEMHLKLKDILIDIFKPLGYRYNSKLSKDPNIYTITKLTKNNNIIRVVFIMSSFHSNFQLEYYYEGVNWSKRIHSAIDKAGEYSGYFKNEENLRCILSNVAKLVEYLEENVVPECDEIMGGAPMWYKYY
ncbi:MAG: hypothetical protein AB6733_17220 [Clostridiaceae bacterium]